jgi:hypothetical protein
VVTTRQWIRGDLEQLLAEDRVCLRKDSLVVTRDSHTIRTLTVSLLLANT